jgi:predicted nucleic-acid-binding protein
VRAVDTNVLVRLITRDDLKQVAAAEAFVASGAWVPHVALAEATWVLASVYDRSPDAIATAVEMLLNHQHLTLQDAAAVTAAVEQFRRRPALGFSECLISFLVMHRGRGLASALIDRALEIGRARGFKESQISMFIGHVGARRVYERAGFGVLTSDEVRSSSERAACQGSGARGVLCEVCGSVTGTWSGWIVPYDGPPPNMALTGRPPVSADRWPH